MKNMSLDAGIKLEVARVPSLKADAVKKGGIRGGFDERKGGFISIINLPHQL